MHVKKLFLVLILFCFTTMNFASGKQVNGKKKFLVVSSYNKEYIWTQETNRGLCDALLKFGYFDNRDQAAEYSKNDYVETSNVIVRKLWMDTKRKNSKEEIAKSTTEIATIARDFNPDLIFLGDDNAANYIGNQFLDSKIPVVFWGLNNTPLKYGLVDSMNLPGHNVTGVYQPGYIVEGMNLLKTLVPKAKTFAIISDDSETGRANYKAVEYLAHKGSLPFHYVETVSTNSFEVWKEKAVQLQKRVDAFFIGHYASLRDKDGNYVTPEEAVRWYITHITIPEVMTERQFVEQGILCAADDSGYKQGFEAVVIAHDILDKGANPATYPPRAPKRGALMVNKQRARMLGITLNANMGIEEFIDEASVLREVQR
jgi:putative ABC transport system substrate-binding protein